jgi:tetratricopeptide (TPR) repeat protein
MEKALQIAQEVGETDALSVVHISLAYLALREDSMDRARTHAESARILVERLKFKVREGSVFLLLGRISAKEGNWNVAKKLFQEAIADFRELHNQLRTGEAYYYFGVAARQAGKKGNAHLTMAEDIFRQIGAKGWLNRIKKANP